MREKKVIELEKENRGSNIRHKIEVQSLRLLEMNSISCEILCFNKLKFDVDIVHFDMK